MDWLAERYGRDKRPQQYLEGGIEQIFIDFRTLSQEINNIGDKLKQGLLTPPQELNWNGIRVEFKKTDWTNVSEVYGYTNTGESLHGTVNTRRLATDEIQTKLTNSKMTAAARTESDIKDRAN
ncbi:hypothetical protein G3N59_26440 [Paraburkholderia sp. Ac-20340]|uniref:hypothetical protein n=1 Tax=Paraburkholderia sp. Ac-20340 TaxID=2703888 RepID=UPI00197DDEB3|nr:hypothetical protein [Paraburkholderia sp. Ac-20340]MBN3856924.1 hypothetical protein [Paraburkholderia sp. Ac-20340]